MAQTTTTTDSTRGNTTLYIAFDLSRTKWQLAISDGAAKPRDVVVDRESVGAAKAQFIKEVAAAKLKFGLPATAPVAVVFEAGRDGFWIQRWLCQIGVDCIVIDPASIAVDRKAKQRKTDQIDARKLLVLLCDHASGRAGLRIVQPPSPEDEDSRQLQRLLDKLQAGRERLTNRAISVMFAQGIPAPSPAGTSRISAGDFSPTPPASTPYPPISHADVGILRPRLNALPSDRPRRGQHFTAVNCPPRAGCEPEGRRATPPAQPVAARSPQATRPNAPSLAAEPASSPRPAPCSPDPRRSPRPSTASAGTSAG